jgi:hypothetical protein
MALRFLGEQGGVIDRDRILQSLRIMLERPQLADLVIRDLARWEDWESMPRLVQLFKEADEESSWVRVPVINYLRACPLPEAKDHIDELAKIDPNAVKRASSLFPFPAGGGVAAQENPAAAASDEGATTEDATADAPADVNVQPPETAADKVDLKSAEPPDAATAATEQPKQAAAGPNGRGDASLMVWIVVIPVLGVVVLLGLMWLILRRPREPIPTQQR